MIQINDQEVKFKKKKKKGGPEYKALVMLVDSKTENYPVTLA